MTQDEALDFVVTMLSRWEKSRKNRHVVEMSKMVAGSIKKNGSQAVRKLAMLKPHERRIMCSAYLLDMTRSEICEEMGISVDEYKIISRDTKHKLRRIIGGE